MAMALVYGIKRLTESSRLHYSRVCSQRRRLGQPTAIDCQNLIRFANTTAPKCSIQPLGDEFGDDGSVSLSAGTR
jgi:hypothetical protein